MRRLTVADVHAQKVSELGLNSTGFHLNSSEAIAGALRRAASFLCPCTSPTLVRGVLRPLRGLVDNLEEVKITIEETLEAMVAHGDIVEQRDLEENRQNGTTSLLYAAPPSFVARRSGTMIILGIASDQLSALPEELEARIEYVNYLRRLNPIAGENLRTDLIQLGLIEISYTGWLKCPRAETAADHISRLDRLLDAAQPTRDVPGLLLLDPESSVRYYRGRWVEPRSRSGRFVARRPQAYGAHVWCYIQLRDGNPERLIDLPFDTSRWRGCDEAWRLQMGIDAQRGKSQVFRVRPHNEGSQIIEFFSPVPMWARRRWDAIGEPVATSGCLFAYRLSNAEVEEELRFARETLWLAELK